MQQERHHVVTLITQVATPLFALFRAQEERVYSRTSGRPSGDMIPSSSLSARLQAMTSHLIAAPASPAGLDHVPWSHYPTRPTAGPRIPPGFDQSRNALHCKHVIRSLPAKKKLIMIQFIWQSFLQNFFRKLLQMNFIWNVALQSGTWHLYYGIVNWRWSMRQAHACNSTLAMTTSSSHDY